MVESRARVAQDRTVRSAIILGRATIEIDYTSHAEAKVALFERYGLLVTPDQVRETVLNPDRVISQSGGKFIAQKVFTARHVLRVIFRVEGGRRVVITFYPGRKERYET